MAGFQVEVAAQASTDWKQLNHGVLFASSKNTGSATVAPRGTTTSTALNLSTVIEPGKKYHLKGIQIFCDRPCYIAVNIYKSEGLSFNNVKDTFFFTLGEKEFQTILPFDEIIYEGGLVSIAAAPLNVGLSDSLPALSMRFIGRALNMFTLDKPDFTICCLGDSKMLSTIDTGAYGERYYPNQLANYLATKGKRVSIVDRTMPGSSSNDGLKYIKSGALDEVNYDLLLVAFGTNNANTSSSTANIAAFKSDLTEAYNHRNRRRPGASIVFNTPGALDKTSNLVYIADYRTAVSDLVTALVGSTNKVYLCNEHLSLTSGFTAGTKSDRFISTELANGQVHYSALGHDDVFNNQFLNAVKATDFYTNVMKLT